LKLSMDAGADVTVVVALTILLLRAEFVGRVTSTLPPRRRGGVTRSPLARALPSHFLQWRTWKQANYIGGRRCENYGAARIFGNIQAVALTLVVSFERGRSLCFFMLTI
ncbi:MAG: hypothetical protein J0H65_13930, partial [Rhizobiales bacterium]|nr:hypothetical protein [Hyphomicrobiales bacterium]